MKNKKKIIINSIIKILLLLVITITIFEIFEKLISTKDNLLNTQSRVYQLKNENHYSPIFRNFKNTFLYEKNSKLTHSVYYGNYDKSELVYKYDIYTDGFGLNSDSNALDLNKKIYLLLGASFAEGTGDKPWTDILNRSNDKIKFLNAGLLGTGPGHWISVGDYLINEEKIPISKIIILYTSDNFYRKEYNLPEPILKCTQFYYFCKGWEIFLGYDYSDNESFVNEIYKWRVSKDAFINTGDISQNLRLNLPATYKIYTFFMRYFRKIKNEFILQDFINKSIKIPSVIIRIPLKEEITNPHIYKKFKLSYLSNEFHIDAQAKCHFNIEDYYQLDEHFNSSGYQKLAKCIDTILHEIK